MACAKLHADSCCVGDVVSPRVFGPYAAVYQPLSRCYVRVAAGITDHHHRLDESPNKELQSSGAGSAEDEDDEEALLLFIPPCCFRCVFLSNNSLKYLI